MKKPYPVVDLFAGPGGLGEGFSSISSDDGSARFSNIISIERDEFAHSTLQLRHFFRSFPNEKVPDEYFRYINGEIEKRALFELHPQNFKAAAESAIRLSLGSDQREIVRQKIERCLGRRRKWALIGGPPCQAYSLVGRSRMKGHPDFEDDERHFLYREYLKIIADHQPPVFVMENVKGLLSAKVQDEPIVQKLVSDLKSPQKALGNKTGDLSYTLYSLADAENRDSQVDPKSFLVQAEKYGVPQARHRMFIVGVRSDLDCQPSALNAHAAPTVREAIGDLPRIRSGVSRRADSFERWKAEVIQLNELDLRGQLNGSPNALDIVKGIQLRIDRADFPEHRSSRKYPSPKSTNHAAIIGVRDSRVSSLTGHEARAHMPSDLRRYMFAAVFADVTGKSPKLADFPDALLPEHKNVEEGRSGKMFSDRFRVQLPDHVATTVTSHISKDGHYFIHYDPAQCRSLTVREAARLQTFPDNYKFEGPRTSQYHQVGNAVPVYLAKQIGEVVAEILDKLK